MLFWFVLRTYLNAKLFSGKFFRKKIPIISNGFLKINIFQNATLMISKRERKKEICFHSNFFHMISLNNLNLWRKPLPTSFQHYILSTLKICILYRTFILSYMSEEKWKLNEIFLNMKLLLLMTSSGDVVFWGCAT